MLQDQSSFLTCPVCKASVPFTVAGLLRGERFICPNCAAAISLSASSRPTVRSAMEELERIYEKNGNKPDKQQP